MTCGRFKSRGGITSSKRVRIVFSEPGEFASNRSTSTGCVLEALARAQAESHPSDSLLRAMARQFGEHVHVFTPVAFQYVTAL
jgi:hypothetical protein